LPTPLWERAHGPRQTGCRHRRDARRRGLGYAFTYLTSPLVARAIRLDDDPGAIVITAAPLT
jgi:hypothetical protein